jgi:hypothetical protein
MKMKIDLDDCEILTIIGALQNMIVELEQACGENLEEYPFVYLRVNYLYRICDKLRDKINIV